MPEEAFELVTVASGARSIRSLQHRETFHPVVGPMPEARGLHVEQQRLVERANTTADDFVIWDVGLGAAANAVAVIEAFASVPKARGSIELHSFDIALDPLRFALDHAESLAYLAPHREVVHALLRDSRAECGHVRWQLHSGDFCVTMQQAPAPRAVLFDPYSPRANPHLWTLETFTALAARFAPSCLISNYTRSTAVRVTLLLAGLFVGRGRETGEKDETTLGSNDLSLLTSPLDRAWLERVRRSTKGAPLRAGENGGPINGADWKRLIAHPQFA